MMTQEQIKRVNRITPPEFRREMPKAKLYTYINGEMKPKRAKNGKDN